VYAIISRSGRKLLALALAAPVLLTACGSSPPRPGLSVSGKFGSDPVITIPAVSPPRQLTVRTLIPGTGPVVRPDDYVLFNVEGKTWAGDRPVADSFTHRTPQGLPLRTAMPAWRRLAGQRVGSRVMMVVPPKDGFGANGDPAALVSGTDTLVFVFDVLGAMLPDATSPGTASPYSAGPGLPDVRWRGQVPVITIPARVKPPKSFISRVITRGSGAPITSGETVTVQDAGVVWRTGKVFDSSWQRGFPESFVLGSGQVIPGWEAGLGGLRVGSRVLLVIPPTMGYAASGDPPYVKTTDTTVFVIDIVSALS
jgi:peptidylprolyl isomerase